MKRRDFLEYCSANESLAALAKSRKIKMIKHIAICLYTIACSIGVVVTWEATESPVLTVLVTSCAVLVYKSVMSGEKGN